MVCEKIVGDIITLGCETNVEKMEPTPPKGQRSRKTINRPFYEPSKKTSAEIIAEARSNFCTVETSRPFTPAEPNRTLFGSNGKQREGRPPSACSIASSYSESRPPTGKRLTPLNSTPDFDELESKLQKLGTTDILNPTPHDEQNNNTTGVSNEQKPVLKSSIIPKSLDPTFSKSRHTKHNKRISSPKVQEQETRRIQSGPKERTPILDEDVRALQRSSSFGDISNDIVNNNNNNKNNSSKSVNHSLLSDTVSIYYEDNIRPLLKQMELNQLHEDTDSLLTNFDILWKTLEIGKLFGKSALGSKRRSELLSTVFKCVKTTNEKMELKLCRLFLAMDVSGRNLEVACKLMFRVSRNKKNDDQFIEEKLLEPIVKLLMSPAKLNVIESLVYLTGTIKFLTLNEHCLQELIKSNALKALSVLLAFANEKLSGDSISNKESCHMLVQVTSALSNFANVTTLIEKFIEVDILQLLLDLMKTRLDDTEYVMNVSRVFSKMTVSETICKNIGKEESNTGILMNALVRHIKKQEIAVRFCFAFGNIGNHMEEMRKQLVFSCNGLKAFVKVAECYFQLLAKKPIKKNDKDVLDEEDALIKVVRVIANVSLDHECGSAFSNDERCVQTLLKILEAHEAYKLCEELVINTSATINNLSFYATPDCSLMMHDERIASVFLQMLLMENSECACEAMRALGNFTQFQNIREFLVRQNGLEVIITLLDSTDRDMVYCACGVLINLMVDLSTRDLVKTLQGIPKLICVMKEIGETDWCLQGLVCQVLWNYSEKIRTSVGCFGEEETDDLITILNEYLEPELALDYDNEENIGNDTVEYLTETWENYFQPVAALLLDRIESHHSNLEPLHAPPS